MAEQAHEVAPHHLPFFLPSADGSDPLMTFALVALIIGGILLGTLYLHLHSLPERLAHKHGRIQFELVAILGLLALFTHNTVFWVAALLLAFIQLPDFMSPLNALASAAGRVADKISPEPPRVPETEFAEEFEVPSVEEARPAVRETRAVDQTSPTTTSDHTEQGKGS